MLFSQGSRFGGHALYVKDGKLKYVYNFVGEHEQIVESDEPIPTGHVVLSASFEREGDDDARRGHAHPPHPRRAGRRGHDHDPAGQVRARRRRARTSARTGAEPVTDDYPGESPVGVRRRHDHKRASIDVSGEPFVDLAQEARMAFARD